MFQESQELKQFQIRLLKLEQDNQRRIRAARYNASATSKRNVIRRQLSTSEEGAVGIKESYNDAKVGDVDQ
jgi:plasmid stability protein